MKRKLTLGLALVLACSCLGACSGTYDIKDVSVPVYDETNGMRFLAYSGPQIANWNGTQKNVSTITDEHMQKFVDAGFTGIISIHEGAPSGRGASVYETIQMHSAKAEADALKVLEQAEKFNVEYYVRDWPFYEFYNYWTESNGSINTREEYERVLRKMFDENNKYVYSSAYAGNFGRDEPGADQFEGLKWQIEIYQEMMQERGVEGEFLLNMLPNYANTKSYGGERGEPISYVEYMKRYFEQLAPLLGYVCYDYYPFLREARTGSLLKTSYVSNLELVANHCKNTGTELRTFVQTGGDWTGLRDLTSVGDFRFQVYMNMAFGSRVMTYYEYGTFNDQTDGDFGLLDLQDGSYNYTYEMAKVVNNEVHAFEDAYLHYNYDGVMCFSGLSEEEININFYAVANKLQSHPRIANVDVTHDAVMTSFKDAEGNDAFMLVNYTDPYYDLDNTVTVQFKDAKALLMYRFGEKHVVPLKKDGTYTFELYPGEGRFIIPLK